MTTFQLISDIHLEHGPLTIDNDGADVLVIAGDALVARHLLMRESRHPDILEALSNYDTFFDDVSKKFNRVVHISGNHEHYVGDVTKTANTIRDYFSRYSNITHLDNETIDFGDVVLVGSTLWTGFDQGDDNIMSIARYNMNDYYGVLNSAAMGRVSQKFDPEDSYEFHLDSINFIVNTVESDINRDYFVVTHHAPSRRSITKREESAWFCYGSELDKVIKEHPQIRVWQHGHIHTKQNYMIGDTIVVANPRGYFGDKSADEFSTGATLIRF